MKDLKPSERILSSSTADDTIGGATAGERRGDADEGSGGTSRPDNGAPSATGRNDGPSPDPEGSDERATESLAASTKVGGDEREEVRAPREGGLGPKAAASSPSGGYAPADRATAWPPPADREGMHDPRVDGGNEYLNGGGHADVSNNSDSGRRIEVPDLPASGASGDRVSSAPPGTPRADGAPSVPAGTEPPNLQATIPGAFRVFRRHRGGATAADAAHRDDGNGGAAAEDGMVSLPNATLVEEEEEREIIYGTPLEPPSIPPLWEQQRARLVLGAGGIALIALSIIIGVLRSLSPNNSTAPEVGVTRSSISRPPSSSTVPTSSLPPSQPPSPPPVVAGEGLFETDCDSCNPMSDMHGNTAVVTRDSVDIQFFSITNSSFELVTQIGIDYVPSALAVNGNTAVIGTYRSYNGIDGVAYIFERDQSGTWSEATRIQPSDFDQLYFGISLAVDGNTIVVGAWGTVFVYRRNESTWMQTAKLTPPDGYGASGFGQQVTIKGTFIAVGNARYEDKGRVFVYAFDPSSDSWTQVGGPLMNDDCPTRFGSIVKLTDDAHLLVTCGSMWDFFFGKVYYYAKEEMGDAYVLQQSIGFDTGVFSLDVDNTAMVLTEFKFMRSSVVHFFERQNNVWKDVATIDVRAFDEGFGNRVRFSGNTTLISSTKNVYPVRNDELGLLRIVRGNRGK